MRVAADAGIHLFKKNKQKNNNYILTSYIFGVFKRYEYCKRFHIRLLAVLLTNRGVRHDHHDVSVGGEDVDKGRKVGVSNFHALERSCEFTEMTGNKN